MPNVMIYIFKDQRNWKSKPADTLQFNYGDYKELEEQLMKQAAQPNVYHVTAFNSYGQLMGEIYKSKTTKGKYHGQKNN